MNIKTSSDLKYYVKQLGSSPYFFTRKTMQFFGDYMHNYGVRKTTIDTNYEKNVAVYELYRRRPVKHNLQDSAYFNSSTFQRVYKK